MKASKQVFNCESSSSTTINNVAFCDDNRSMAYVKNWRKKLCDVKSHFPSVAVDNPESTHCMFLLFISASSFAE